MVRCGERTATVYRTVFQHYLPLADIIPHSTQVSTCCTWLEIPSLWSDASCNMCVFQRGWFTPSVRWYESGTYCLHHGLRCIPCHREVENLNQATNLWHMSSHSLFLHISCLATVSQPWQNAMNIISKHVMNPSNISCMRLSNQIYVVCFQDLYCTCIQYLYYFCHL